MIPEDRMVGLNPNIRFDRDTRLFISASSSPGNRGTFFYNHFFRELGLNAVYLARKISDAGALTGSIRALGLAGCSVSMPMKSSVIPFLDALDPLAERVGSVNTILSSNGLLTGFNTDVTGFVMPLKDRGLVPESVLIFGYGSVVSSVVAGLREINPGVRIEIEGRDPAMASARASGLGVNRFSGKTPELFVNATPATEFPVELNEVVSRVRNRYELPVRPLCVVGDGHVNLISGDEMFKWQFLEQFRVYTGIEIDPERFNSAATLASL